MFKKKAKHYLSSFKKGCTVKETHIKFSFWGKFFSHQQGGHTEWSE